MIKVIKQAEGLDVLKILKETDSMMEGHFKLTSGYHSKYYLQCAKLLQHPKLTLKIASHAAHIIKKEIGAEKVQAVVSPAIGGILFGYMLAYELDARMVFTERVKNIMELRRGFVINPGEKIIIAEDVITTGGSVKEVIDICKENKADIQAISSIVDRSDNIRFEFPYCYLIKLDIKKYLPQDCPLCRDNLEFVYPGSKKQK